jgi:hypothetical protein
VDKTIIVRPAKPEDAPVCGRICFDAFYRISTDHGFPPDFPSPEVAVGAFSTLFSKPGYYCLVAESEGSSVGSICLDERSAIAGLGPITVDPRIQNRGVALIAAAEIFAGPGIIVPTRNSSLFRWCLENGLRVVQPMTLMTSGLYNEPAGAYLPSILF